MPLPVIKPNFMNKTKSHFHIIFSPAIITVWSHRTSSSKIHSGSDDGRE